MSFDLAARLASLVDGCRDAVFVLNHRRRFVFVNEAWAAATGVPEAEATTLTCREREAAAGLSAEDAVRRLCSPPAEVLSGQSVRVRRLWPDAPGGQLWWDVDFMPLCDADGAACVIGRITPVTEHVSSPNTAATHGKSARGEVRAPALVERLAQLRERVYARHQLDAFASGVPAMRRAVEQARLAAQNRFPVFLHGEAGTGKEWLARAIHAAGAGREHVFIALDCEHLPMASVSDVFYGEHVLDGHIPVGTIYLREPGFLPRDFQVRLLEFARETSLPPRRGRPLPRIIAGSRFRQGDLHEDLYHCLSVQSIELVPLRERRADLAGFVEVFLQRLHEDAAKPVGVTAAAMECLHSYGWPGNLAELLSVLGEACKHASNAEATGGARRPGIDVGDLPRGVRLAAEAPPAAEAAGERALPLEQLLKEAERRLILLALSRAGGNKTRAAEMLSIFRPRLLRRMEALGIADPSAITEEES